MMKSVGKKLNWNGSRRGLLGTALVSSLSFAALTAALMGLTVGCTQDPYADKGREIRNAVSPDLDREPPVPKATSREALYIESLNFYTFKEQVDTEIAISSRVLLPGWTSKLTFENKSDFPGAQFDEAAGKFKWNPPRGSTGYDYGGQKSLRVRLTAYSPTGGTNYATEKDVLIFVTRAELDPQIVSVEDLVTIPTREGEFRKFTVVVKDPDAADADGKRPRLLAIPSVRGDKDLSGLVYLQETMGTETNPTQDPNTKNWIFKMVLDLRVPADQRGRDYTRAEENFKFGLQVTSQFGRVGMSNVDAKIRTDVLKPEVSWFDPIEAVAGIENVIQFNVYDPYAEGKLSVNMITRVDQLPGAATSVCKLASREGNILCRLTWKPPASTTGDFTIEFEALNQSKVAGDLKFTKETFKRLIRVKPGQPPSVTIPTTPPPTTPAPTVP